MKLVFFLPDFKGGGAQNMLVNMANEFARRGHDVTLLVIENTGPYAALVAPDVRVAALGKPRTAAAFFALRSWLSAHKPDLVLSALFHVNVLLIAARLTLPGLKTKIIVTERNHFSARIAGSDRPADKLFPLLVALFYRYADLVVGISAGVADDIRKAARLPARKVTWIHNPVVTSTLLAELDHPGDLPWRDVPVIVASGRLVLQKDYPTLLSAFAALVRTTDARLLILGDGPLRPALAEQATRLGIADKIHFAGFVPHPVAAMKNADLFVMTSRWEGFCNVIVEALLCGLPVVATDCPSGPAEILDNGAYGTLVPPGDVNAVAAAMAKGLSTAHDSERQRQRALDFTVEKICDAYEDACERVMVAL